MARPTRSIWGKAFRNFIDSFKPRSTTAELMGEDRLGNKYYEAKVTTSSHRTKPHRYYAPHSGEEDFMQELPAEWEAWLRGRRKVPPSPEELAKNYEIMMLKKENAKQLEAEREGSKLLDAPTKPKGFESYPQYGNDFEDEPGRSLDPGRKK